MSLNEDSSHAEDPVQGNPFSADDPRRAVWKKATREALIELHQLKLDYLSAKALVDKPFDEVLAENFNHLAEFSAQTQKQQQERLLEFIFNRFQIWAKRAISIVRTDQCVQDYQRWLKSQLEAEVKLWTDNCPEHFDAEWFLGKLRRELNRALEHWVGQALQTVACFEAANDADEPGWIRIKHDFQQDLAACRDCPTALRPAEAVRLKAMGTLRSDALVSCPISS